MSEWQDAEFHADRALELYERGRWAEAEAELRKALSLNPDQPVWHFNLGLTLEAAGRDDEALAAYEQAADLMPGEAEPMLAAGMAANRVGRHDRALTLFDKVLRIDPHCEPAYSNQMDSLVRLERHEDVEVTFYLAQQSLEEPSANCLAMMAESLWRQGEYGRCAWCLREALRLDPSMPRLRARLGGVLAATGKPQRALQMFLRELRDDPGSVDTLLDLGDLLVQMGRMPEAAEKYRRVLELEPANLDAHFRLGEIAMDARRFEQAHVEFELVFKLDPEYPHVRLSLAQALLQRDRFDDARRCLRDELDQYRAAEPEAAEEFNLARLGDLLLRADMPREAAECFDAARQSAGDDGERIALMRKLALARFRSGDRAGGMSISRAILRHDPSCVEAMHNLALAALEDGRIRTAAGWIRRGLKTDRHDDGLRRLRVRLWFAWLRGGFGWEKAFGQRQ